VTLEEIRNLYDEKGDFKHTFEWYLPVSCKLKIAQLVTEGRYPSENQAVYKALEDLFKKETGIKWNC